MRAPEIIQIAVDEFNTNYPRPGIEPLAWSTVYDLVLDWPKHYPFKRQQGVYCFVNEAAELLYVGKTSFNNDFGYRLSGYFEFGTQREARAKKSHHASARYIYVIALPIGHGFEAGAIEEWLIGRLSPPLNIIGNKSAIAG